METQWEGWIYKQGSLVPSWKKRYMVLKGRNIAYYDKEAQNPRAKEKGTFTLAGIERNPDIKNGLNLAGYDGKLMKIYTKNGNEFMRCYNAMSDACTGPELQAPNPKMLRAESSMSYRTSSSSVPRPSASNNVQRTVTHSGWLEKEGQNVKSWKKRFFVLSGTELTYYDRIGGTEKGGGRIVDVSYSYDRRNSLTFILNNDRVLNVAADSEADMQNWYNSACGVLGKAKTSSATTNQPVFNFQNTQPQYSGSAVQLGSQGYGRASSQLYENDQGARSYSGNASPVRNNSVSSYNSSNLGNSPPGQPYVMRGMSSSSTGSNQNEYGSPAISYNPDAAANLWKSNQKPVSPSYGENSNPIWPGYGQGTTNQAVSPVNPRPVSTPPRPPLAPEPVDNNRSYNPGKAAELWNSTPSVPISNTPAPPERKPSANLQAFLNKYMVEEDTSHAMEPVIKPTVSEPIAQVEAPAAPQPEVEFVRSAPKPVLQNVTVNRPVVQQVNVVQNINISTPSPVAQVQVTQPKIMSPVNAAPSLIASPVSRPVAQQVAAPHPMSLPVVQQVTTPQAASRPVVQSVAAPQPVSLPVIELVASPPATAKAPLYYQNSYESDDHEGLGESDFEDVPHHGNNDYDSDEDEINDRNSNDIEGDDDDDDEEMNKEDFIEQYEEEDEQDHEDHEHQSVKPLVEVIPKSEYVPEVHKPASGQLYVSTVPKQPLWTPKMPEHVAPASASLNEMEIYEDIGDHRSSTSTEDAPHVTPAVQVNAKEDFAPACQEPSSTPYIPGHPRDPKELKLWKPVLSTEHQDKDIVHEHEVLNEIQDHESDHDDESKPRVTPLVVVHPKEQYVPSLSPPSETTYVSTSKPEPKWVPTLPPKQPENYSDDGSYEHVDGADVVFEEHEEHEGPCSIDCPHRVLAHPKQDYAPEVSKPNRDMILPPPEYQHSENEHESNGLTTLKPMHPETVVASTMSKQDQKSSTKGMEAPKGCCTIM
ncbi:hypothetical protein THRCLA_03379 [Thraustotheca clavata]|uniref:PH domain-containing protein n=1 Tax=Thraustotheca clavata TaxID=74557 RepID=A0A1W0A2V1_9STRA|nr:hypothetical protein THRCLA_03379 [Thraustotheca clavata]